MKTQTIFIAKDGQRFDTETECDQHERLPERIAGALRVDTWRTVSGSPPPEGVEVLTKIHDEKGERNQCTLKLQNNLWWAPDMSIYVYYRPTHWMPLLP